ncbi:hypothetical protein AVEN_25648-1 [Araneus ventricosus]|uniref:Uncharacterized protein n=1 Tax=Araneus ventricosus TaxID=182803 RepID=A0A4Y2BN76_ARAVE|nr:hypothetical protein AVEN_25648-1 [Araneus ventricosus]
MCKSGTGYFQNPNHGQREFKIVVVSYSTWSSPQLDQVQESPRPQKIQNYRRAIRGKGGGDGSVASVATKPWTPEGRSLTLSIVFMLLGIMEWPSRFG